MERNRVWNLTFVSTRSLVCLFIVIFSSIHQITKAQTTFESEKAKIKHQCPEGWFVLERSYRCAKIMTSFPASTGATSHGITWPDAKGVCEHEGAELMHLNVYGSQGLTLDPNRVIFPSTDLLRVYLELRKLNVQCVWTGMYYGVDGVLRWSTEAKASEKEAFWGWRMPSEGATNAQKNKFNRAVAACKEQFWDRYYYNYADHVVSWYKKLPVVCQMRAPLENYFPCINGERVPTALTCNDENDCGDNSDEQDCASKNKNRNLIMLSAPNNIDASGYTANQQSQWIVQAPAGTGIKAEMKSFDTEEQADFAEILIGGRSREQMDPEPLDTLSGKPELKTYYSYNNYMMVTFTSDSVNQQPTGFNLAVSPVNTNDQWDVTVAADGKWEGMGGQTQCTDNSMLEPGLRYVWIFTAPKYSVLTLQLGGLKLCADAFLEVRDGADSESPLLAKAMGEDEFDRHIVTSTRTQMYVYLQTGKSPCKGGCIQFTVADGCTATLSTIHTVVTSPGYGAYSPARYPNNVVCRYYLSTPNIATASIVFDDFEMKDSGDVVKIYPLILPTANETTTMPIANVTMGDTPGVYPAGEGRMTVIFNSSVTQNVARGFKLVFARNCEYPQFNNFTKAVGSQNLGSGATLTVTCATKTVDPIPGYFFAQEEHYLVDPTVGVVMTCNKSRWDVRATPNCERRWCGFIPDDIDEKAYVDIGESNALSYSVGVRAGDNLAFGCYDDLGVVAGSSPLECPVSGVWNRRPRCGIVTCTLPTSPPQFGNFSVLNRNDGSGYDGTRIGSVLGYTCEAGYVITEGPNTYCTFSGSYHVNPLSNIQCQPKYCALLAIENGIWTDDQGNPKSEVNIKTSIRFKCNGGFEYTSGNTTIKGNDLGTVECDINETLSFQPKCTDIDECATNNGNCQAKCENTVGSFICSCDDPGFRPPAGGSNTCQDIDECTENTDNCNPTGVGAADFQACVNNEGSYECKCPGGYELFNKDGLHGVFIPPTETGMRVNDTYHLNHTCVPIACPALPIADPNSAVILSRKLAFAEGDIVDIDCQLGFKLINRSNILPNSDITFRMKCSNGQWDAEYAGCEPARCKIKDISQFTYPPSIGGANAEGNPVQLGDYIEYGKSFTVNSCTRGAEVNGNQPNYQLPPEIENLFFLTVTCVYNPLTSQYILDLENAMDCFTYVNQTNCGDVPTSVTIRTDVGNSPLYDPSNVAQITYKSRLFFDCGEEQLDGVNGGVEGNLGQATPFFGCQKTGIWSLGSMNCKAPLCPDPGRIADARQLVTNAASSVLSDTSYQVGVYVVYNCSKPGYEPEPATPLKCEKNSTGQGVWAGTVPKCVDKEKPMILNCPNDTVFHDPFMPTNMAKIMVTDNSGANQDSLFVTIDPPGFSPTTPIAPRGTPAGSADFTVKYNFTDLAGNWDICEFKVRSRDKVAPIITCPTFQIKITKETPEDFTPTPATAVDAISTNVTVVTEPSVVMGLTPANISQFVLFTATATDEFGNNASCQYTVQIEGEPCAPWALPSVANGSKTFQVRPGGGYYVDYVCDSGFAFYETPEAGSVKRYECTGDNQTFTPVDLPFCQPSETSEWHYRVDVPYCNWDSNPNNRNNLTDPVCQVYYKDELLANAKNDTTHETPTGPMWESCQSYRFSGYYRMQPIESETDFKIVDLAGCPNGKAMVMEYTFQQFLAPDIPWTRPSGAVSAAYFFDRQCRFAAFVANLGTRLESRFLKMYEVAESGNCRRLSTKGQGNALDTTYYADQSGFQCAVYDKQYTTNTVNNEATDTSEVFCYGCPAGKFPKFDNFTKTYNCTPVPVGTYKSEAGAMSSCPGNKTCLVEPCTNTAADYILYCHCPAETNTFIEGAIDESYCRTQCIKEGLISRRADGLSPCITCPSGTYAFNATSCEPCPGRTNTGSVGGRSIADCRPECPVGTYSSDGYKPENGECIKCPLGFYGENPAQTACMECANDMTTLQEASNSSTLCVNGAAVGCDATNGCGTGGNCSIDMHQKVCTCPEEKTGATCGEAFKFCDSKPCAYDSTCALVNGQSQVNGLWYSCNCQASTITDLTGTLCENEPDNRNTIGDCLFDSGRGSPMDLIGGAKCNCKAGFSGDNCELADDACKNNPCDPNNSIKCIDYTVRYQCECKPGWGGLNCDVNINECFSNPCRNGECVDLENGFQCKCGAGFTGASCETPIRPCDIGDAVCTNAKCIPEEVNYLCLCDAGHEPEAGKTSNRPGGDVSTGACRPTDNCANVTCQNGGTCTNKDIILPSGQLVATYECTCTDGFEGRDCQHNKDNCIPNPCKNGTCVDGDNDYSCTCFVGYTGKDCDVVINGCDPVDPCNATNTKPSGCSMDITSQPPKVQCDCKDGFVGQFCETNFDDCVLGSKQCYHNGQCIDEVGSYRCQCTAGWTGQRCEDQVNECASNPCVNGGTCYDLHNNYRCGCPAGFAGQNCNTTTDICRDVKPCYEGSTCLSTNGNLSCICRPDRTGKNCELLIDGCLNNPCLNDGTCSYNSSSPSGFTCECSPGYSGPICNDTIDYCAALTCPANTPCINIPSEQRGTCQCRGLKAPVLCTKEQDMEKDVYFGSPDLNNNAIASWYSMRLGVEGKYDFTLGFWFRFAKANGVGNILTLYGQKDALPLQDDFWIFRLDEKQMYLNNYATATGDQFPFYGSRGETYDIDTGSWNYAILKYEHTREMLTLYVQTVVFNHASDGSTSTQKVKFDMSNETFNYANIVLGYFEDKKTGMNSTFEGYVSHVCLWNKALADLEIQRLSSNRKNIQTTTDELSGCMDFTPKNGASTYRDSQGMSRAGEPVTLGSSFEPSLVGCPKQPQTIKGSMRPVQIDLTPVTSPNAGKVDLVAELSGSQYLVNGTYTNVIVGTAKDSGKVATCYYDVVVKAYECTDTTRITNPPANLDIKQDTADGADGNYYAAFSCPTDKSAAQPVPDFFTCPTQGAFSVSNQYEKFFWPQCADTSAARINLIITYIMPKILPCDSVQNISGIRADILKKAEEDLNKKWVDPTNGNKPAFCPDSSCETASSDVLQHNMICLKQHLANLGRRRKRNTDADKEGLAASLTFNNLPLTLKSATGTEVKNTYDLLREFWIRDNNIYTPNVLGSLLDPEGTTFDVKYICEKGQARLRVGEDDSGNPTYICVDCPAGETWYAAVAPNEDEWGYCKKVPEGYFNPNTKQIGLPDTMKCPTGFTTEEPGAIAASQCKELKNNCAKGSFINEANQDCEPCPIGFFQPIEGQFFCWPCPASQSTANVGTVDITDCKDTCPAGTELRQEGGNEAECKPCLKGYYRQDTQSQKCLECPDPKKTTPGENDGDNQATYHDNVLDCSVRNCPAGDEIDNSPAAVDGCKKCEIGFFTDRPAQENCTKCPGELTTQAVGTDSGNKCQLLCEAGFETGKDVNGNDTCVPCRIGTYKKVRGINPCNPCDDPSRTTPGTGSTDNSNCTIANCDAGQKVDGSNACVNCTRGEYHEMPFSTRNPSERAKCLPCGPGADGMAQTTIYSGTKNSSECVKKCDSGFELDLNSNPPACKACPDTKYRFEHPEGPFFCEMCPTTPNPTRRPIPSMGWNYTECTLGDCTAGQYGEGPLCKLCPDATYNALPRQLNRTSCIQCTCADVANASPTCKESELTTGGPGLGTEKSKCKNVCDGRCTKPGESCTPNANETNGYKCDCKENYLFYNSIECRHRCEANWCFARGTQFCIRDPEDQSLAICRCEESYEGLQCDVRKDPQGDTQYIIGGAIGAAVLVLSMLLLCLWVCWCFKKDRKRIKKEPTVAPTIYQPYMYPVYDSLPFQSQPPKVGTPVGSLGRQMYYPPMDAQSMTGYNTQPMDNNVYSAERVYADQAVSQQFYEDPPEDGYNDYSTRLPNGNNPYQGGGVAAFSEGGDLYAEVNKGSLVM